MDEEQWLNATEPRLMLEFLRLSGRASERKLRLFAVACCRLVWPLLADQGSWAAVEAAERYADGQATLAEMTAAAAGAWVDAARAVGYSDAEEAVRTASTCGCLLAMQAAARLTGDWATPHATECGKQADALRDIIGNPCQPLPEIDSAWLLWDSGSVRRLAETIYETGRFEDLPVLADALEDAGCTAAELLGHLRGSGLHLRGCWPVDLLLGKE